MRKVAALLIGMLLLVGLGAKDKSVPVVWKDQKVQAVMPKARPVMGVHLEAVEDTESLGGQKGQPGVRLAQVIKDGPAEKAGLKTTDVVIGINGKLIGKDKPPVHNFILMIIEYSAGDTISLDILRDKKVQKVSVVTIARPEPPANDVLRPDLKNYSDWLIEFAEKTIKDNDLQDVYESVKLSNSLDEVEEAIHRLKDFRYMHRDPLKTYKITTDILNDLKKGIGEKEFRLDLAIATAARELDAPVSAEPLPSLKTGLTPKEHIDQIVAVMSKAKKLRDEAFSKLTKEEIDFLAKNGEDLMDKFIHEIYLDAFDPENKEQAERFQKHVQILRHSLKVDYSKLCEAARVMSVLSAPEYLKALQKDLEKGKYTRADGSAIDVNSDEILFSGQTAVGQAIIAGKGENQYRDDCAILIDLGGDDRYYNNAGGCGTWLQTGPPDPKTGKRTQPDIYQQGVALCIDFAGNDLYNSTSSYRQGSGFLGVGMLIDLQGNDIYESVGYAQGVGFFGAGFLIDFAGNDTYQVHEYGQGAALFGLGFNIDMAGNDRYHADLYAQGIGMPRGFGYCFDKSGDDYYYASGKYPTGYGTEGNCEGFSQGLGIGFRGFASGGFGVMQDLQGKDKFVAGNFSQGTGYFFACGIFENGGKEDDIYIGGRYGQAAAAHSAVSAFYDEGGNDVYDCTMGVIISASWDLTTTIFIDYAGNDTYKGGGFSLGSSAHNGLSLFLDLGGTDNYVSGMGNAGPNDYHGGPSLSLIVDAGGQLDKYPNDPKNPLFVNNSILIRKEWSLFYDMPGKIEMKTEKKADKKVDKKEKKTADKK
jgi:hypothetical protein